MRREHFDELEADFYEYYNKDVATVASPQGARLMFQLPQDSRIFKKLQPANNWGWQEVLLNKATYFLEILAWSKTKDATRKAPKERPKLFLPDFLEKTREINKDAQVKTVEEIKAILAKPRK